MIKDFIPYEQALELKELDYNEPCFGWFRTVDFKEYFLEIELDLDEDPFTDLINSNFIGGACSAPLYQQAFRWFRDKYDIHYSIDRECSQHDFKWGYNWSLYNWTGIFDEYLTSAPDAPVGEWVYNTYEEAELACLRELIKIVKNK